MPKLVRPKNPEQVKNTSPSKKNKQPNSGNKKLSGFQKKPKRSRKPKWDSTTTDLNVHKLSNLDLEVRHQTCKSKNIELARHELYDKARGSYGLESSGNMRPSPSESASVKRDKARRQMAIRQSLHGKQELHNVLAKSDRTMRVVKDLFGDDPKRYSCQPNVTVAPHVKENKQILEQAISESRLDGPLPTAQASPGGIRDQSVREMAIRKPALNEFPDVCEALSYDGNERDTIASSHTHPGPTAKNNSKSAPYKPGLDLNRFQELVKDHTRLLPTESRSSDKSHVSQGRAGIQSDTDSIGGLSEMSSIPLDSCLAEERRQAEDTTIDSDMSSVPYRQAHSEAPPQGVVVANQQQCGFYNQQHNQQQQHILPNQQQHDQQQHDQQQHSFPPQQQPSKTQPSFPDKQQLIFSDQQQHSFPDKQQHSFLDQQQLSFSNQQQHSFDQQQHSFDQQQPSLSNHSLSNQPRVLPDHPLHVSRKMMKQTLNTGVSERMETKCVTASSSSEQIHTDLTLLGKFIRELEQELNGYEKSTTSGSTSHSHPNAKPHPPPGHDSWSEAMGSLLVSVRRMLHYLHQSEVQLKGEVAIRGQFLQALHEQQDLMDVLTADLMSLRKENMALRQDVTDAKKKTSNEIATLKVEMIGVRTAISGLRQNIPGTQAATMLPSRISGQGGIGALWSPPNLSMDNTFMSDFSQLSVEAASRDGPSNVPPDREDPPLVEGQQDVVKSKGLVYAQATPLSHGNWSKSRKGLESNGRLAVHQQQRGVEDQSSITKQTPISNTKLHLTSNTMKLPPTSNTTLSSKTPTSTTKLPLTTLFQPPPKVRVADSQPPSSMGPLHGEPEASRRAGSHDFLGNLCAPAPPPLSVALQVPVYSTALRPQLAPPTSLGEKPRGVGDGHQTADTAYYTSLSRPSHSVKDTHQTRAPLTETSVPVPQSRQPHTYTASLTPPPPPAAGLDASDDTLDITLSAGARPEYGYATGAAGPKGGVSKPMGFSLDTTLQDVDDKDLSGVFDVARLLESLQQLNKTQDQLQATASKLNSLPVGPSQDQLLQASVHPLPLAPAVSLYKIADDIKLSVSIQDSSVDFTHFNAAAAAGGGGGGDGGLLEGVDLSPQPSLPLPGEACLQESADMPDQWTGKVSSDQLTNKVPTEYSAATNPKQASTGANNDPRLCVPTPAITKRKVSFDLSFGSDHSATDHNTTGDDLDTPGPKELLVTTPPDRPQATPLHPPGVGPRGHEATSMEERRVVGGIHTTGKVGGKENTWFALSSHLE